MIKKVDEISFKKILEIYCKEKGEPLSNKIEKFLLEVRCVDNFLNLGRSVFDSYLIEDSGKIIGFETFVRPFEVKVSSDSDDDYYYIEKRRITIDSNGHFVFTRLFSNFYVYDIGRINYDLSVERIVYSECEIMIGRSFGKRRRSILSLFDETMSVGTIYDNSKTNVLDIDYNKIFDSELLTLVSGKDDNIVLSNDDNESVVMIVRCERKSHDVAYIRIYKHDSNLPSFYEVYFSLDGNFIVDLPEVMFPLDNNHGDYELDCMIRPKSMEECGCELNEALRSGKINKLQFDYLIKLVCDNNRSSLECSESKYEQGICAHKN